MSDIKTTLQTLIDNAVEDGVAPGLQCVVFDKDQIIFSGSSGYASLPSESNPDGKPMTNDTILWIASSTKLVISLLALHVLDKGLIEGVSIDDLDNPDALAKIVPEFAPGSGSLITKIIEGFEDGLGSDGKKIMKLRDAKNRATFRHLLTHSSGMGYAFNDPLLYELLAPSDGSKPHIGISFDGAIRDFTTPLLFEPGEGYHYGAATDWLAQAVIRGTGKHLRQLMKEIIFEPLQIPSSEMDIWLSSELRARYADVHVRDESSPYKFKKILLDVYSAENGPEEGMAYVAESALKTTSRAHATILQAVLAKDPRIMSPETWDLAFKDDFGPRGIKVTRPDMKSMNKSLIYDVLEFSKTGSENGTGMNLLQCKVALVPTLSGRPAHSFGWAGGINGYFSLDPINGLGSIISTQLVPFFDSRMVQLRDKLERIIYKTLAK